MLPSHLRRSHCCSPRQFGKKKTLILHKVGTCPTLNGKAIAELRPIRRQSSLTYSQTCFFRKITVESRNVFARLAKGSQDPAHCLWNYRLLSRSGGLLLEKLTHSLQIEASKHRPVGCLFVPKEACLSHLLRTPLPSLGVRGSWRSFLRGCFHGAGADPGDPHAQGKGKPHG